MRIEFLQVFINAMAGNTFFRVLMVVIAADTVLGVLRAIKFRQFNSSVGIDGAIRKVAMLASAVALMAADLLIHVNLMAFVPENYIQALGIQKLGMCEFFCLLFILYECLSVLYECLSVLKNMVLCGLPVPKKLRSWLKEFLENMTTEMPEEELDKIEQK